MHLTKIRPPWRREHPRRRRAEAGGTSLEPFHSEPLPNTHDRAACRAWLARYRFREIGRYVRASRWERRT